jgi:predicted CDP-diglyceride synthetase/phosphatidate cytidylyltransferase
MTKQSELTVDVERVRKEHLAEVDQRVHWAYLIGVLAISTVAMLLMIAWLGSAAA